MKCFWQGEVQNVVWPKHDHISLNLELWWPHKENPDEVNRILSQKYQFQFSKYTNILAVPLWSLVGNEFQVLSKHSETKSFFAEFAGLENVCVCVTISESEQLILYSVKSSMDKSCKIFARVLDFSKPFNVERRVRSGNLNKDRITDRNSDQIDKSAKKVKTREVDVRGMVQHMILAALRLRGFKQGHPDFKLLYTILLRAVMFAVRNVAPRDVTMEMIRAKVEGILAVIE